MSYPLLSIVDLPACFWQERISSIRLHWVSAEITTERSCSATWDRTFRTQPAGTWRRWGHLLTETVVLRHKHTSLKWWSESGDDGIKEQKACQGEQSPLCVSHRRRVPQPGKNQALREALHAWSDRCNKMAQVRPEHWFRQKTRKECLSTCSCPQKQTAVLAGLVVFHFSVPFGSPLEIVFIDNKSHWKY